MKKMLIIPMMVLMLVALVSPVFASSSLAEKIYEKGAPYGVTESHKKQMDEYFTNYPTTAEEDEYVLARADECIAIMDKAGVKDVTKLSTADLDTVKAKVQDAAKKIGLTVSYNGDTVEIRKNGKLVTLAFVRNSTTGKSTTAKKFVYTGADLSLAIGSVVLAGVAIMGVAKLRKNA